MPLSLRRGRVTAILERHDGLVRLEVDGVACVAYPSLTGPVELEDEVLVNVQARELELGSGGFDVLYANLTRGLELPAEEGAHVMVLPYTPLQHAPPATSRRRASPTRSSTGMPVVCCSLHSQVAPVCAALGGLRVAYVQLAGGALPVSLSDTVRTLARARAGGGDRGGRAVLRRGRRSASSVGLGARLGRGRSTTWPSARSGPGSSGPARGFGHGGARRGRGRQRGAGARRRARDRGSSLGRRRAASATAASRTTPRPCSRSCAASRSSAQDGEGWREACEGLPLSHMGRGPDDDPDFFAAAYAAGVAARELVR